nr:hypothetical protein [Tanacetum cinerariifolium]
VLKEEIASPVELAKAYMASRPYKALKRRISILEHDIRLGGPLQHVEKIYLKEKSLGSMKSPTKRTLDILHGQAVRSLEKGDSPRLLSYPLNELPLKLLAEPPHKKRAFRTSVPGSDLALAADLVATSTLPGVSITHALVEPPQKKCAFQMSAPEDDSFEIDDALAADIVANSTLLGVSLTPALVENNKQMFPKVVKVLEQAEPKALKLTSVSDSVTTNGHAKLTNLNKVENENDQNSTNIFGKDG